jgi:hypothetical protein
MDQNGKILPRHNDDENPTVVDITFPTFFEDKDPKGPFIYYVVSNKSSSPKGQLFQKDILVSSNLLRNQ